MKYLITLLILLIAPSVFAVEARDSTKNNADDGHLYDGSFTAATSYLQMGVYDDIGASTCITFDSVDVPQGATINSAIITIRAYDDATNSPLTKIYAVDEDNQQPFTQVSDFSAPNLTTASVDWDPSEAWSFEVAYNTPDISSVIEEVVGRPGWAAKNSITIIILNDGGTGNNDRLMMSNVHGDGQSVAEKLIIDYTESAPPEGGQSTRRRKIILGGN